MSLYNDLNSVLTPYANKIKQNEANVRLALSLEGGGAPTVVSSISSMTNTSHIYVLSTDGKWYYHNGSSWVAGGEYGTVATDKTLALEDSPADAKAVGDAVNGIKAKLPEVLNSDADNVDLDISDTQGNVIARFADGHIQTKEFDSSFIGDKTSLETIVKTDIVSAINEVKSDVDSKINSEQGVENVGKALVVGDDGDIELQDIVVDVDVLTKGTDADESDLDIADPQGNVLVRFTNGHIQTKYFDSNDSMTQEDKSEIESELLAVPAVNISNADADMDISDESGDVLVRFTEGGIQTKFFDSRRVMPPIVISVKQDGTGDFTSLRYAIDSISDANPETKPYRIEIYPGTYNVFDDFTDEEIATATQDYFVDKDNLSFCGIMLTDGISLRGIGNRDDIIIHGELSPDTWSSDLRNYVSTLNLQGTMSLENVTVTARYIRYCVHDDQRPEAPYTYRYVKSCKFRISGQTSGFQGKTWGEGSRYGKTTEIEDCDFGTYFAWHSENQGSSTKPQKLIVRDSVASAAMIACRNHQITHQVYLYNVIFPAMSFSFANISSTAYRMGVTGTWKGSMIDAPSDWNYTSGDVVKFAKGSLTLGVGAVVKLAEDVHPYAPLLICTNKYAAYGAVVGIDNDWVYVQNDGYINVNRFGFTGLVEGDKLTIGVDGYLEINGTGDTFAVCNWVSQTYGTFAKVV